MKRHIKKFLQSSAFIWLYYFSIIGEVGVTNVRDGLTQAFTVASLFFPIALIIGGIIPVLYIRFILRKEKDNLRKCIAYFSLSWIFFLGLIFITQPVATWIQNQVFFGGQREEHKQILLLDAEISLEEKLNRKFELYDKMYTNKGSFDNIAFNLAFHEEKCVKDCYVQVYLSYEEKGWRMKIINGEIWYLKE